MSVRFTCLAALAALCFSACGSPAPQAGSNPANQACQRQATATGPDFKVMAAIPTTVGWARLMVPDHEDNLLWPSLAGDDPAVMCFLDGPVAKSPPNGLPFERELVVVAGGEGVMLEAGYRDSLALP